ncbi:MAG: Verru_Chthon cassette protein A [Verrucomicrobiales bacterium]
MKPTCSTSQLSARRTKRKQEKGVALVTVLAIVLLMTVLIMSFFTMATSELTAAQKDTDNLRVRTLADAAVNMVIGQIREATTSTAGSDPNAIAPWSSQPGAIRTYNAAGNLLKIYKLYSSSQMAAPSLAQVNSQDLKQSWDQDPAEWVDMNAPVIVPNLAAPSDMNKAELYFPIVDPRALRATVSESVEGFNYTAGVAGVIKSGATGGGNSQRLAMPVRWLYVLADGSIGHVSPGGEFMGASGGQAASKENPIVGRVAFWTDDETCKINVNTASEGVFWDSPRASTDEELALGRFQPQNGEYQRYPGHPAMVSMSSVLFPYRRWAMGGIDDTVTGSKMKKLDTKDGQSIWRMAPYIYGEDGKGSFGGTKIPSDLKTRSTGPDAKLKGQPNPKHLYNSYDDYLFSATSDAKLQGSANDVNVKERRPVDRDESIKIPVDRVKQARFFVTTRSAGPEITLHGTPRMCLWPIDSTVKIGLSNNTYNATSSRFTIFDSLIAFNSSLQSEGKPTYPYYFQRSQTGSRHNEFYGNAEGRNKTLWTYVNKIAGQRIPGFSGNASGFRSFAEKYDAATYGDLPSLTGMMFDYIRNQNLYDGNLIAGNRYVNLKDNFGQITPICLCGGAEAHRNTWYFATVPRPKGMGRFLTVSEVSLLFACRSRQDADGNIKGDPYYPKNSSQRIAGMESIEVEVGLLIEGFVASHGWGEYRPQASFQLGGGEKTRLVISTDNNPPAATGNKANFEICSWALNGKKLVIAGDDPLPGVARTPSDGSAPEDWIAWGGTLGVRFLDNMITFKPALIPLPPGASQIPLYFSGSTSGGSHPRLIVYDTTTAPGLSDSVNNVEVDSLIQCIPLAFPEILPKGKIFLPSQPGDAQSRLDRRLTKVRADGRKTPLFGPGGLIRQGDVVQSLVPNHGDLRLLSAKRMLFQGRTPPGEATTPKQFPTFVAHPMYGEKAMAHNIREPMPDYDAEIVKMFGGRSTDRSLDSGYFEDGTINYKPEYLPDFPIRPRGTRPIKLVKGFDEKKFLLGVLAGGDETVMSEGEVFEMTRYDRDGNNFKRGIAEPGKLQEFNTGIAMAPDGPYANRGDDGEIRGYGSDSGPYFGKIKAEKKPDPKLLDGGIAGSAPNRVIASAGAFGSLPSGLQMNVPWQTLLFRPDMQSLQPNSSPQERHYGSRHPRDHLFLDLFWMPVVEPYAISEPFETKGKINMNYQILPFTYITRATALHALFKAEKIMAIPENQADQYKSSTPEGDGYETAHNFYRHHIDAEQTLKQWEKKFSGTDDTSQELKVRPGAFISASEICDMWLVPEGHTLDNLPEFWATRRLSGDNVLEKPYANLYPRLTTRSNTYRVHVIAQALRKVRGTDPGKFDTLRDQVSAEYRGSYLVERSIDPTDRQIKDYAGIIADNAQVDEPLDRFYTYRISQVKQFAR